MWVARNLLVVAAVCGAVACSSAPPPEPVQPAGPTFVPAGVDSSVAAAADSLADASFVEPAQQDEALQLQEESRLMVERSDSIWLAMAAALDTGRIVTQEDSIAARVASTQGGATLVELEDLLRNSELDVGDLAIRTEMLLDSAQVSLERAFQLNPFDSRNRVWLAQVYGLQARRLGQTEAYDRAIAELEKLALVTPDEHTVFAMLANNYFYVQNWDGAALNYQQAEDVYRATYDLVVDEQPTFDSELVYSYAQAQGDMHVRRFDAARAVEAYDRALVYAPTPADSSYVVGELEWMAWDDMNILSSFARDSLLALEQAGDLQSARDGYADLLTRLSNRDAMDETEWRLGIVDYNLGNTSAAAERLQALVARTPTDASGVPFDSTHARYFDDYGTLTLNLGRSARADLRDSRTALKYFTQATELAWSGRAVAHFEVARLLQGNTGAALESATRALEGEDALSVDQRAELYRLLMELHRRTGDFDAARRFRDAYRAIRG
ncbi:MAG: hypothetical protein OEN56_12090 [Gemmatimonadota bacterium]|nr:hypothetical protein [Gemmatimonadota bacterium]